MKTTEYREYIENGRFKIEAYRPGLVLAQLFVPDEWAPIDGAA